MYRPAFASVPDRVALAALLFAALLLGINGIGRSLWLDEAWVANSINAPSVRGMFYYPNWLQSSPPLFLLASRAVVHLVGLSNVSLRAVPLLMALLATAAFFDAARKVLPLSLAVLACTLLVFLSAEVEYSRTAKQYSGEVAVSSLLLLATIVYLQEPQFRKFGWLAAAVIAALPFSYASVFLIPGVVLAVYFIKPREAVWLGLLALTMLAVLYVIFIRQNVASHLHAYWTSDSENGFSKGTLIALGLGLAAAGCGFAFSNGHLGIREWTQVLGVLPCILLAIVAALGWYPLSYRTRLFAIPGLILAIALTAEDLSNRFLPNRRGLNVTLFLATLATVWLGIRAQIRADPNLPKEDVADAVRFLQETVPTGDRLLIHPSVGESFRLYADMYKWEDPPVVYGDTGWPCCPRGKDARQLSSNTEAVVKDMLRMVPSGHSGRIWLLYTIRPTHWDWVGLDESRVWRSDLATRGCLVSRPNRHFENLAITVAECEHMR